MKEIKLKNGEILTIFCPTLDDAQKLADITDFNAKGFINS